MRPGKKIISLLLPLFLLISFTSMASPKKDIGPETMNLKERFKVEGRKPAVVFPHRLHQEKLDRQCAKCHVNEQGGGTIRFKLVKMKGVSNDFHKKFCWPCHLEMKVPRGKSCSLCHKR